MSVLPSNERRHILNTLDSAVLTITAGMIAVMNATGMTAAETTVLGRNVTVTIAMIVTVKKGLPGVTGPALLPVVAKMIVAPGLLPPGGIMKIKGLQGTMIDGEAMMTGEVLTLIMIVAGTTAGTNARSEERRVGKEC